MGAPSEKVDPRANPVGPSHVQALTNPRSSPLIPAQAGIHGFAWTAGPGVSWMGPRLRGDERNLNAPLTPPTLVRGLLVLGLAGWWIS